MNTIYDLEKSIAPNPELKLSMVAVNDKASKKSESISPEHWDYWAV